MNVNINCIYNDKGAWCTNKNIKRSLFGLGARCCVEFNGCTGCAHKVENKRPKVRQLKPCPPNGVRYVSDGFGIACSKCGISWGDCEHTFKKS